MQGNFWKQHTQSKSLPTQQFIFWAVNQESTSKPGRLTGIFCLHPGTSDSPGKPGKETTLTSHGCNPNAAAPVSALQLSFALQPRKAPSDTLGTPPLPWQSQARRLRGRGGGAGTGLPLGAQRLGVLPFSLLGVGRRRVKHSLVPFHLHDALGIQVQLCKTTRRGAVARASERTPLLPARRCSSAPAGSPGARGWAGGRGGSSSASPGRTRGDAALRCRPRPEMPPDPGYLSCSWAGPWRQLSPWCPTSSPLPGATGGRPRSAPAAAATRRSASVHAGPGARAEGRGRRGRRQREGAREGRNGEEEEGPAPGRAVVAQPQPPPHSAAGRAGAGCRRARLQNRCRRRRPANPHRHLPPPPPPAAPPGVRAPRQAARGRGKAMAPESDGNSRAPSERGRGETPSSPAPSSASRCCPGSRRGGMRAARKAAPAGAGMLRERDPPAGPARQPPSFLPCAGVRRHRRDTGLPHCTSSFLGARKGTATICHGKNVIASGDVLLTKYAQPRMTWV